MENRFEDALKKERSEVIEREKMDETLSEPEEDLNIEATPVPGNYSLGTTRKLLKNLSWEKWADTAPPPLGSHRKNPELQLGSKPVDMGMVFLNNESKEKTPFRGTRRCFEDVLMIH